MRISDWSSDVCSSDLFDGLVAVEHARKTPTGVLYNEVPDRVADSLFLVALGYAAGMPWCGWLAALLAALTAYIRTLGGTVLGSQDFRGPMRSEEHTSELQSLMRISYAVFCLKKKNKCTLTIRQIHNKQLRSNTK